MNEIDRQINRQSATRRWLGLTLLVPAILLAILAAAQIGLAPPTARAQTGSGITDPGPSATVSGLVTVTGTAVDANFQRYELYFKPASAPAGDYAFFDRGESQVTDGFLGVWESDDVAPGLYTLRLRVVRTDGNYSEYFVREVQVAAADGAAAQVATATPATATPAAAETETPVAAETGSAVEETADPPTDAPQVLADQVINVRGGPSTDYPIVAVTVAEERYPLTGVTEAGDWLQIEVEGTTGWVLGALVSAENIDAAPTVTELPPLPETADEGAAEDAEDSGTPSAEEAATEEPPAEEAVAEEAAAAAETAPSTPASTRSLTVSLVGADDLETLQSFALAVVAAVGPGTGAVTATVAALPADLPLALSVPSTATVVGAIQRSGDFAGTQILLSSDDSGADLLDVMRQQLLDGGFTTPPSGFGGNQVFLASAESVSGLLCSPADELFVNLTTFAVAGAADLVGLSVNTSDGAGGDPCVQAAEQTMAPLDVLPQLASPADAAVESTGAGGGDGAVSAEATIRSATPAAELAAFYEQQLETAGWEPVDRSTADNIAWSGWTFVDDDGEAWDATFYVVSQAGDEQTYLAAVRAQQQ